MSCTCKSCCDSERSLFVTVPCRLCEKPTSMTGTRLCDRCWELERRIFADPVLAKKILDQLYAEAAQTQKS